MQVVQVDRGGITGGGDVGVRSIDKLAKMATRSRLRLCLFALALLVRARSASARSCVRVFYDGVERSGACPANAKYEEVCSGWLAFDEGCDDVMPSITATGNWEQVMSSGNCATLLGSDDGHAVLCREGSSLPGRLILALKWVSLLGWPLRAIAMVWTAAQQPASERAQESLFPLSFTLMVLYVLVGCGWVRVFFRVSVCLVLCLQLLLFDCRNVIWRAEADEHARSGRDGSHCSFAAACAQL
jgi:hypothetical protein